MRLKTLFVILLILAILVSCDNQIPQENTKTAEPQKKVEQKQEIPQEVQEQPKQEIQEQKIEEPKIPNTLNPDVVGVWRPYQETIIYDSGASNKIKPVTRRLTISQDGTWEFGSKGTWEIKPIESKDWDKWGVHSQEIPNKIVLHGWNNAVGDGPVEVGIEGVDFIWVIYRSEKLSLGPATIQIKFGH